MNRTKLFLLSTILAVLAITSFSMLAVSAEELGGMGSSSVVPFFTNPAFPTMKFKLVNSSGISIAGANIYLSYEGNVNIEYQLEHSNSNGIAKFAILNNTLYNYVVNGTKYHTVNGTFTDIFYTKSKTTSFTNQNNETCATSVSISNTSIFNSTITLKITLC